MEDEDIPDFCRYVGHRTLREQAGEGPRVTSYALRDRDSVRNVTQAKGPSKPPHLASPPSGGEEDETFNFTPPSSTGVAVKHVSPPCNRPRHPPTTRCR